MDGDCFLARASTPDGGEVVLYERGGVYTLRVDGCELMSSRAHSSEEAMAEAAVARLANRASPRVLLGGLGMGFTLRAALDRLPRTATVVVCEILAAVVRWCRGPLAHLAGHVLDDPRVEVEERDVVDVIESEVEPFDIILLDVDNGPGVLSLDSNRRLYSERGLRSLQQRLVSAGVLVVWSASPNEVFEARLRACGFAVKTEIVPARGMREDPCHTLFIAKAPAR